MNDLLTIRYRNPEKYLNHLTVLPELCPPSQFNKFMLKYPLDKKLPVPKCAKSPVTFSRNKVGAKIWKSKTKDFNLQCRDVDVHYDPLHDPHLKVFFANDCNRALIQKRNLITDDDTVICTLKDFNTYRRYLFEQKLVDRRHLTESSGKSSATKAPWSKTVSPRERDHRAVAHEQYLKKMLKNFKNLLKYEHHMEKIEANKATERQKLEERAKIRSEAQQRLKEALIERERRRMFRLKERLDQKTTHFCTQKSKKDSSKPDTKTHTLWRQQQEFRAATILKQTKMLQKYQRKFQKAVKARHKNFVRLWQSFNQPSRPGRATNK